MAWKPRMSKARASSDRWASRVPALSALALAAWLTAVHAGRTPAWEAPDEPWHLVYAERLAAGVVPSAEETYEAHHPPGAYLWLAAAQRALGWPRLARPPYEPRFPLAPNAYHHEPAHAAAEARLRPLRMLGALLALPGFALLHAAAKRAGAGRRGAAWAVLAACLPPVVPATLATVNNDGAAFLAGSALTYGVLRLWRPKPQADGRRRCVDVAALAAAFCLMALSKLNVWPLLVLPVAWVLVGRPLRPGPWPALGRRAAMVAAAALGAAGLLALLAGLPLMAGLARLPTQILSRGGGAGLRLGAWADDVRRIIDSSLGYYGWQNLLAPPELRAAALLSILGLSAMALVLVGRALRSAWGPAAAAAPVAGPIAGPGLLLTLAIGAVFAAVLANGAADPAALQGRLLLPALPAWSLLASSGIEAVLESRHHRWLLPWLLLPPFVVQAVALAWLLPQARGEPGRPAAILLRQTTQVGLRPDVGVTDGQQRVEVFVAQRPLHLARFELPVLASAGSGSLRLSLSVETADGRRREVGVARAELGRIGRASVEGRPRLGPLADTDWLALSLAPALALGPGDRLRAQVEVVAARSQDAEEAAAWLWATDRAAAPASALRPESASGPGDPDRSAAWIAYSGPDRP